MPAAQVLCTICGPLLPTSQKCFIKSCLQATARTGNGLPPRLRQAPTTSPPRSWSRPFGSTEQALHPRHSAHGGKHPPSQPPCQPGGSCDFVRGLEKPTIPPSLSSVDCPLQETRRSLQLIPLRSLLCPPVLMRTIFNDDNFFLFLFSS